MRDNREKKDKFSSKWMVNDDDDYDYDGDDDDDTF